MVRCYHAAEPQRKPSRVSRHCSSLNHSSLDSSIVAVRDPSKSGARGIDVCGLGEARPSPCVVIRSGKLMESSRWIHRDGFFVSLLLRCLLRVSTFFIDSPPVSDAQH